MRRLHRKLRSSLSSSKESNNDNNKSNKNKSNKNKRGGGSSNNNYNYNDNHNDNHNRNERIAARSKTNSPTLSQSQSLSQSLSQSQSQPSIIGTSVSSKANSPDDRSGSRSRSRSRSHSRNGHNCHNDHDQSNNNNSKSHGSNHGSNHRSEISLSRLYTMDTDFGTGLPPDSLDFSLASSSLFSGIKSMDRNRNHNRDRDRDGNGSTTSSTSKSKYSSCCSLTNGSSMDQDSFVVMSTAGLSSVGSSLNSFYSYDPFTGQHEHEHVHEQKHGDGHDDDDDDDDDDNDIHIERRRLTQNMNSNSQGQIQNQHQQQHQHQHQHHYLHARKTTKRLPRLTGSSVHDKAFLSTHHHHHHNHHHQKKGGSSPEYNYNYNYNYNDRKNKQLSYKKVGSDSIPCSESIFSSQSNAHNMPMNSNNNNNGNSDYGNNKYNNNNNNHDHFPRHELDGHRNDGHDEHGHGHGDGNDYDDNERKCAEFPVSPLNTTPQFHIPVQSTSRGRAVANGHGHTHGHTHGHGHRPYPYSTQQQHNNNNHHQSLSSSSSRRHGHGHGHFGHSSANTTTIISSSSSPYCNNSSCNTSSDNHSERAMSREHKVMSAAIAEKEFWKKRLKSTIVLYGKESVETATQLNNLGSALLRCKEHSEALSVYKKMIGVLRQNFDDDSLVYARALDKVGLAASMCPSQQNLEWALLALNEALHVRLSRLGPHHCDTVDTLNNIAGVFLHMKEWAKAKDAYVDVLTVRAAIFGNNHPSIAVTAQTLGKVCSHLSDFECSLKYFELALFIYRGEPMMLNDNHPLIKGTIRNIDRTERLMASLGISIFQK